MRIKRALAVVLALVLVLTPFSLQTREAQAASSGMVRVWLKSLDYYGSLNSITVTLNGTYSIPSMPEVTLQGRGSYTIDYGWGDGLYLSGDGIEGSLSMGSSFTIQQHKNSDGSIGTISLYNARYGNRSYRGDMRFDCDTGSLRVINRVYIEDYLYGVLGGELSNLFPLETLKAQAIIARSYVYNKMLGNEPNYEINDTSSDQVYKGYNSSDNVIIQAVNETAGVMLKYGSSYVNAYFGASNGGQVELPGNAWGSSSSEGCYVMKDDEYDVRNPSSRSATYVFNSNPDSLDYTFRSLIETKLGGGSYWFGDGFSSGYTLNNILSVSLEDPVETDTRSRGVSRNYQTMRMTVQYTDSTGSTDITDVTMSLHDELKYILFGADSDLRLFSLSQNGDTYYLTLARYGHGVGMSQRGAQQMAKEGFNYKQIINFYFNDVSLPTVELSRDIAGEYVPPAATPIAYGRVSASSVNVRREPSASATKLGSLTRNSQVGILSRSGDWYAINFDSTVGYVSAEYIVLEGGSVVDPGVPTPTPTTGGETPVATGRVTLSTASSRLNLRQSPSTSSSVVTRLSNGEMISILSQNNGWYKVRTTSNLVGYVSQDYIRVTSTVSPTPTPSDNLWGTPTPTPTPTAGSQFLLVGRVNLPSASSTLNVRSGPSDSAAAIGSVGDGTKLEILSEVDGWYKVVFGSGAGYVAKDYVSVAVETPTPSATPKPGVDLSDGVLGGLRESDIPAEGVTGQVVTSSGTVLPLYNDASTSNVRTYLDNGTQLTVYGVVGSYYFVSTTAGNGFVPKDFIKTPKPAGSNNNNNNNNGFTPGFTQWDGKIKLSSSSSTLNLRAQATTSSQVITTLRHGAIVTVTGESGDWYRIAVGNQTGYVMKKYISSSAGDGGSGGSDGGSNSGGDATVYKGVIRLSSASTVNVRQGPGTNYSKLGSLSNGAQVNVLYSNGDWYKIEFGGGTGYVLKSYIRLTGETGGSSSGGGSTSGGTSSGGSSGGQVNVGGKAVVSLSDGGSMNVRSGPGTDYGIEGTVRNGDTVTVVAELGEWSAISAGGVNGYIKTKYLSGSGGSNSSGGSGSSNQKTAITTGSVNLRATGSASGDKLGTYSKGTRVTVVEKGSSWSKVSVDGKTGYMKNTYLSFD